MTCFPCPYLDAEVELTEERERHIASRHPDLLPEHRDRLARTLADPDLVRRSARFGTATLFSRWYRDLRGGKYVVVVVVSAEEPEGRHWIVTAYLKCPPYAEQESEELGDEIIARLNPRTGEIENLEVLFFSTRLLRKDLFELPVVADLRLPRG